MRTFKSQVGRLQLNQARLGEVLTKLSKLPLEVVEDAATKGAVWVQRNRGKILRERSLETKLDPLDTVTFFYDPNVLKLPALTKADCLFENKNYGVWVKEAGVVPQGTQAGDHASLMRFIESKKNKEVFLVHRLDRETAGLMIFAYNSLAAGMLSGLFQRNEIKKEYQAIVLGQIWSAGTIDVSLDDKKAVTHYEVLQTGEEKTLLSVKIETGRLHQIRRHLDHIGHPVMGDPKYGRGNKNRQGLQLLAKSLSFRDPWDKKFVTFTHHSDLKL